MEDNKLFSFKILQLSRRLKIFSFCRYRILITTDMISLNTHDEPVKKKAWLEYYADFVDDNIMVLRG